MAEQHNVAVVPADADDQIPRAYELSKQTMELLHLADTMTMVQTACLLSADSDRVPDALKSLLAELRPRASAERQVLDRLLSESMERDVAEAGGP